MINKYKISVSLSAETIAMIQTSMRSRKFRNKSHVVEYAIQKLVEAEQ